MRHLPFGSLRISPLHSGGASCLVCLTLPSDTLTITRWRLKDNYIICGLRMGFLRDSLPSKQDRQLCLSRSLKMWQSVKIPQTEASQNRCSMNGSFPTHVTGRTNQAIKRGYSTNYDKASVLKNFGSGMQSFGSAMNSA